MAREEIKELMNIKKVYSNQFNIIEEFLYNNFSAPTHWPDWNLVVSKFFDTNFYYLVACDKLNILGICPIHKVKNKIIKRYYSGQFKYIPYGGWLLNNRAKKYPKFGFYSLSSMYQIFSLPFLSEFYPQNISKINYNEFKTLIIDLRNEIQNIWEKSIDSKRRNMIRKAEKNGIKIEIKNSFDKLFYEIYYQACIRNNLNHLPYEFFIELEKNSKNIKLAIFNGYYNSRLVSNIVVVYDKNYSLYWLGNKTENFPNLGINELLQWEAIKFVKNAGCRFYDLCYIEKERLPNIYEFKKGFSKREEVVPLIIYKSIFFKILNKIFNL